MRALVDCHLQNGVNEEKTITLDGLVLQLRQKSAVSSVTVSLTSGWEGTAGFSKKTAHPLEQERGDLLKCRQDWFDRQGDFDPARLVLSDETGLSTK